MTLGETSEKRKLHLKKQYITMIRGAMFIYVGSLGRQEVRRRHVHPVDRGEPESETAG
jgi:hypothetical protein